jgi:hypothetical protein
LEQKLRVVRCAVGRLASETTRARTDTCGGPLGRGADTLRYLAFLGREITGAAAAQLTLAQAHASTADVRAHIAALRAELERGAAERQSIGVRTALPSARGGDSASLPPGTIDFRAVVDEVLRQQSEDEIKGSTCAGLLKKGQSVRELYLKDDSFFRRIIQSVENKWQDKG